MQTDPLYYWRVPTAAVMGITQKEMWARAQSCENDLNILRSKLTIMAQTLEAQANMGAAMDAVVKQLKQDVEEINKMISEKQHPLRYLIAAQRNDLTNLAGTVQMLSDNLNKVTMTVNNLACVMVKVYSEHNGTMPQVSPRDMRRTPTTPVNMTNIYGNHPPMLSPTPTRATEYDVNSGPWPRPKSAFNIENVD